MIKVQYDAETGEVKNAFDSSIEVSGAFVTVSEDAWNSLAGMKLKVVDGAGDGTVEAVLHGQGPD